MWVLGWLLARWGDILGGMDAVVRCQSCGVVSSGPVARFGVTEAGRAVCPSCGGSDTWAGPAGEVTVPGR